MIIKELDACTGGDNRFMLAGRAAEEQLAFYLRRAFEQDDTVRVFNGLRFEKDGDAAQIDHLLLHRLGMIIVESKSVVGDVSVNEHQEWARRFAGGSWMGMPSPILQGRRQGDFLHRLMEGHVTRLLPKTLGFQQHFGALRVDVLVGISDRGVIRRPKKPELPEICKADQVPDRANEMIRHLAKVNSPLGLLSFSMKDVALDFNKDTMDRITQFFFEHNRPLWAPARPVAVPAAAPVGE